MKGPFFNVRRPTAGSSLFRQALGQWRPSKKHADDALSFPARTFCVRPHPACGDSACSTRCSTSGSQNIKPKQQDNSLFLAGNKNNENA